jgi:hypothetical protein
VEPPKSIKTPKVIAAEGADAMWFFVWAYQAFGAEDIQVLDFGGITDLKTYLATLRETPGFEQMKSLVVARDAETDAAAALSSVRDSLKDAGFPVPRQPFSFSEGRPRTAVLLFPGFVKSGVSKRKLVDGTLEDLCLSTVADDPLMTCVSELVQCARNVGEAVKYERKVRLHGYLAAKGELAGLKLGEATKAGAWDLEHPAMEPFKKVILSM